jgi:NADH-ubiquinone oxidoreductase chain 5
MFLT